MDTHLLSELHPPHKHEERRRSERAFPVMLVVSFLVFSACAAFAVVMTNGPDGRAAADPLPEPTLAGGTSVLAGDRTDKTTEALEVSAAMTGGSSLTLGEQGRLVITVTNPHEHAIVIDQLDVKVQEPPLAPGCRPEWLRIGTFGAADEVTIAPGDMARVALPYELVDLPTVNQDACKGAEFPLLITGSGRPA